MTVPLDALLKEISMKIITIQITAPKGFFPDDESKPYTQEQHLTLQLGDYLPRLITENLEELPLLGSYEIKTDDVDVSYEDESYGLERFLLEVAINLDEPRSTVVTDLNGTLKRLVDTWLEKMKQSDLRVDIDFEWRRRSGRLR